MTNRDHSQKPSSLVRALTIGIPLALSVPAACGVIKSIDYVRARPEIATNALETTKEAGAVVMDNYRGAKTRVENGYYSARYGNFSNCGDIGAFGLAVGAGLFGVYRASRPWRRNRKQ